MSKAEIYALCCPETGEVRYIGKANNTAKRLKSHLRDSIRRNTPVYCWIRSLAKQGKSPIAKVLVVADEWEQEERRLIAEYRGNGARLLNVADGGNEPHCSKTVRAENGAKTAKAIHSDPLKKRIWELKRALGDALRRGRLTEGQKGKMRSAALKQPAIFGAWANI